MRTVGVALSVCLVVATAMAISPGMLPWAWEDPIQVATNQTGMYDMVLNNAPAIALDANRILTGMLDYDGYSIKSKEAVNEANPDAWTTKTVFSDNSCAPDPAAFGLTTDYRQAVWSLEHEDVYQLVHKHGSLEGSDWESDTSLLSFGSRLPYHFSMASQGEDVFVVHNDYRIVEEEEYSGLSLVRSSSQGEPEAWTQQYIRWVHDGDYKYPSVAVFKETNRPWEIHVCWVQYAGGGNQYHLKYIRSTDGGATWVDEQTIAEDLVPDEAPCIQTADWYNTSHDRHGLFVTWSNWSNPAEVMMTYSTDNGASWGGQRYTLPNHLNPADFNTLRSARLFAVKRGVNDFRITLTSPFAGPWGSGMYTWTVAHVGNGLGCISERVVYSERAFGYSCTGDYGTSPAYKPRLRTVAAVDRPGGAGYYQLAYQGAEYTFDMVPIAIDGVQLPPWKGIALDRSHVNSSLSGVACADPCGDSLVVFRSNMNDSSSGWDVVGFGTSPSLATDENGRHWIVTLRHDSVLAIVSRSDSELTYRTIFAGDNAHVPGPPSLAMFQGSSGRLGNVVFPLYSTGTGETPSMIMYAQFDTLGNVVLDTVDAVSTSYGDSACCICTGRSETLHVVYSQGTNVLYRTLTYSPNDPNRPGFWSGPDQMNAGQFTARSPYCEQDSCFLYVVFRQKEEGAFGTYYSIKKGVRDLRWGGYPWMGWTDVKNGSVAPLDNPVISTPNVVTWAESSYSTGKWRIGAKINDSLLYLTSADSSVRFCSVVAETSVRDAPSTSRTRVRLLYAQQTNGDSCQVVYNAMNIKVSNAALVTTRFENGCKLLMDTCDTLVSVYANKQGGLTMAKRKDTAGDGWSTSTIVPNGNLPALALDYHGAKWCTWLDGNWSEMIGYGRIERGSTCWNNGQVYMCGGYYVDSTCAGAPSIAAPCYDQSFPNTPAAYIVFAVYNHIKDTSYIVFTEVGQSGMRYACETLDKAGLTEDSLPSIICSPANYLYVSWSKAGNACYRVTTDKVTPGNTTPIGWTTTCALTTGGVAMHPVIAVDADTVVAAWARSDSGQISVVKRAVSSQYDAWGSIVNVGGSIDTAADYPSVTLGDSNIVCYHRQVSTGNWEVYANVNFNPDSRINLSKTSDESKYGQVLFELHGGTHPVIHSIWSEQISPSQGEMAYRRYELGEEGGGGGQQSAAVIDLSIKPMLFAPAPNPFRGITSLRYQTNIAGRVRVRIYDLSGREVRSLVNASHKPGVFNANWDGLDNHARRLSQGIYFVRLNTPNYHESRKLVLMR